MDGPVDLNERSTHRLGFSDMNERGLEWLNYHHLHYFWVVAHEGSIVAAGRRLRVSHPTISSQLKQLEQVLGAELFERRGRGLALTDTGRTVLHYADEIFTLGRELVDTVHGRPSAGALRLRVGVVDVLPKSVIYRLIEPAFELDRPLHLVVREDRSLDGFLAELVTHELDIVLSDRPPQPGLPIRLYSHVLGESGTVFLASPDRAAALVGSFPGSLDGAPMILPSSVSALRRSLDAWFAQHAVSDPLNCYQFDDTVFNPRTLDGGCGQTAKKPCRAPEIPRLLREAVCRL